MNSAWRDGGNAGVPSGNRFLRRKMWVLRNCPGRYQPEATVFKSRVSGLAGRQNLIPLGVSQQYASTRNPRPGRPTYSQMFRPFTPEKSLSARPVAGTTGRGCSGLPALRILATSNISLRVHITHREHALSRFPHFSGCEGAVIVLFATPNRRGSHIFAVVRWRRAACHRLFSDSPSGSPPTSRSSKRPTQLQANCSRQIPTRSASKELLRGTGTSTHRAMH